MDISGDKISSGDLKKIVETSRFGPFTFQIGVDDHEAEMLLQRVAETILDRLIHNAHKINLTMKEVSTRDKCAGLV